MPVRFFFSGTTDVLFWKKRKILIVDQMTGLTRRIQRTKSEVTANNILFKTQIVQRAVMLLIAVLSLIWVRLPDLIPGFLDDILILMSVTVPLFKKSLGPG